MQNARWQLAAGAFTHEALDGTADGGGAHPSGMGSSLRMPLIVVMEPRSLRVGNGGPGQADLGPKCGLPLKPHLPLLVRHLGPGR